MKVILNEDSLLDIIEIFIHYKLNKHKDTATYNKQFECILNLQKIIRIFFLNYHNKTFDFNYFYFIPKPLVVPMKVTIQLPS